MPTQTYLTDLTDSQREHIRNVLPTAKPGGRPAQEVYSAVKLEGRVLYPIGASCWIWEENAAEGYQSEQHPP